MDLPFGKLRVVKNYFKFIESNQCLQWVCGILILKNLQKGDDRIELKNVNGSVPGNRRKKNCIR